MAEQNFTNIKTISQLPPIYAGDVSEGDLFEVSHSETTTVTEDTSIVRYNSRAVTASSLNEYFAVKFVETMRDKYRFPMSFAYEIPDKIDDCLSDSLDPSYNFAASRRVYDTFLNAVGGNETNELSCPCRGTIVFKKYPMIDADYLTSFGNKENYVMNLGSILNLMDFASPLFINNKSNFSAVYKNVENNLNEPESVPLGTEDEKHNRYLFRLTNYRSNEWRAPASGIFTCWGWVDMHTDAHPGNNSEAWLALEGKIGDKWCILQVQPFDKHNGELISYVGFTFPVQKGLLLRITSGFRVGSNSGKYQQVNGSLANHIANCFVGGIYYSPMREQTGGTYESPEIDGGSGGSGPIDIDIDTIDNINIVNETEKKTIRTNEIGNDPLATQSYVDKKALDNIVVIDGNSTTKTVETDEVTESDPIALKSYVDKAVSENGGSSENYYIQDKDFLRADNSHLYKVNLNNYNVNVGSPWSYDESDKTFIYTVQHDSTVLVTQQYEWNSKIASGIEVSAQIGPIGDDTWYSLTRGVELCSGDNPYSSVPLNVKARTKFKFKFYTYGDATHRIPVGSFFGTSTNFMTDSTCNTCVNSLYTDVVEEKIRRITPEELNDIDIPWCYSQQDDFNVDNEPALSNLNNNCLYYTVQHDGMVLVKFISDWSDNSVHEAVIIDLYDPNTNTWNQISQNSEVFAGSNDGETTDTWFSIPFYLGKGSKLRFKFGRWSTFATQSNKIDLTNYRLAKPTFVFDKMSDTGSKAILSNLVTEYYWTNNGTEDSSDIEIESLKRNGRVEVDKNGVLNNPEQSTGDFELVKEFYWDHEDYPALDVPDIPTIPFQPGLINDDNSNVYNVPLKSATLNVTDSPWTADESEDAIFYYTTKHDGMVLANIVPDWSNHVDGIDVYMNLRKTDTEDNWILVNRAVEENSGSNSMFRSDFPVKAGTQFRFEFYTYEDEPYKTSEFLAINDIRCKKFIENPARKTTEQLTNFEDFKTTEAIWSSYDAGALPEKPTAAQKETNLLNSLFYTVQHDGWVLIKMYADWGDYMIGTIFIDIYDQAQNSWIPLGQDLERYGNTTDQSGILPFKIFDPMTKLTVFLNKGAKIRFRFGRWSRSGNTDNFTKHTMYRPQSVFTNYEQYGNPLDDLVTEFYWDDTNNESPNGIHSLRRSEKQLAKKSQVLGTDTSYGSVEEFNFMTEIYWDNTRSGAKSLDCRRSDSFDFHEEKMDESKKSTVAELKAKLNAVIEKLNSISGEKITVDDL